jgi:hypothetical protein
MTHCELRQTAAITNIGDANIGAIRRKFSKFFGGFVNVTLSQPINLNQRQTGATKLEPVCARTRPSAEQWLGATRN